MERAGSHRCGRVEKASTSGDGAYPARSPSRKRQKLGPASSQRGARGRAPSSPTEHPLTDTISPEVVRCLFSYLDVQHRCIMAQVCTACRAIAEEPWIWANDVVTLPPTLSSVAALDCLSRRGIRSVIMSRYGLRPALFSVLLSRLPKLKSLDLSDFCLPGDDAILSLLEGGPYPSLERLCLYGSSWVTNKAIEHVTTMLPSLRELNVRFFCNVGDAAAMALLGERLPQLKVLSLKKCGVSDAGLKTLAGLSEGYGPSRWGTTVTDLRLKRCERISDLGLEYVSRGMPNLVNLDLSECCGVTDGGVAFIADMASLKRLALCGCENVTRRGIRHLAEGRCRLSYLDVGYCTLIDDDACSNMGRGSGLLCLKSLVIQDTPITDRGLSALARALAPSLTVLDVSGCKNISRDGIAAVSVFLRRLRMITMMDCPRLTTAAIKHLANMPSLQAVFARGCQKMTGRGMKYVARSVSQVKFLVLDVTLMGLCDNGVRHMTTVSTAYT
ncbi:hypothetical protein HPB48_018069 [Haemaphysalis longicornis]|uniref:Uncharacterized protein n=1 Tax=Haemaphysalis longicornis TaxID=44386 RepID=A0A9J6FWS3_HAELO|nr:hypothetical protein HPB48_018069 [Haemaphysalis longicornis]